VCLTIQRICCAQDLREWRRRHRQLHGKLAVGRATFGAPRQLPEAQSDEECAQDNREHHEWNEPAWHAALLLLRLAFAHWNRKRSREDASSPTHLDEQPIVAGARKSVRKLDDARQRRG
jgi:hypothetical protein